MYLSKYFLPIVRDIAQDGKIISHELCIKAGLVKPLVNGIYSWMPLGLKIIHKIEKIIREEMYKINVHEILMPAIHPASLWQESGRYNDYGKEMLKIKDRHDNDLLFGPTHEEVITDIFRNSVHSYKTLPTHLFQMQWKFRDEIRPRHGIMRSREFFMKDSYSFDLTKEEAIKTYHQIFSTYLAIFRRIGVEILPTRADSGAIGGDFSHEFHIISSTGENKIFTNTTLETLSQCQSLADYQKYYLNVDELHEKNQDINKTYHEFSGIEVGHVFYFGTKYSQALKAFITDNTGENILPHMGSYGIGISRLVAAIIEASHDEKGIIWPKNIAPYQVIISNLSMNNEDCRDISLKIYTQLQNANIEVLYDDSNNSAGQKIKNAKLLGIPQMIIIGKSFINDGKLEIENRYNGQKEVFNDIDSLINYLQKNL